MTFGFGLGLFGFCLFGLDLGVFGIVGFDDSGGVTWWFLNFVYLVW